MPSYTAMLVATGNFTIDICSRIAFPDRVYDQAERFFSALVERLFLYYCHQRLLAHGLHLPEYEQENCRSLVRRRQFVPTFLFVSPPPTGPQGGSIPAPWERTGAVLDRDRIELLNEVRKD